MQLEADARRDGEKPRRRNGNPEHELQCMAVQWAGHRAGRHPELELLHAIPNAGLRGKRTRSKLLAEGLKAGVWDLFLPVPRAGFAGLYLETKIHERRPTSDGGSRMVKTHLTPEQRAFGDRVREQGFCTRVYRSLEEFEQIITDYLAGRIRPSADEPGIR
jgi:hypothetical protein